MSDLYVSPLGDQRDREVPCSRCGRPTLTLAAVCIVCVDRQRDLERHDEHELHADERSD